MTPIYEELGPLLKDVRNRLNDLTLLRSLPKTKSYRARPRDVPQAALTNIPVEDCFSGKAGKIAFPVLVGEVSNLYKASKSLPRCPINIDLRGCFKDEALGNSITACHG